MFNLDTVECVRSFGLPNSQLDQAFGICVEVDSGNLFVSDADLDRALVFDKVGAYLRSIADTPKTLLYPQGLCHHAGLLYIADSSHHRVVVYDSSSGELVRSIGARYTGGSSQALPGDLIALS